MRFSCRLSAGPQRATIVSKLGPSWFAQALEVGVLSAPTPRAASRRPSGESREGTFELQRRRSAAKDLLALTSSSSSACVASRESMQASCSWRADSGATGSAILRAPRTPGYASRARRLSSTRSSRPEAYSGIERAQPLATPRCGHAARSSRVAGPHLRAPGSARSKSLSTRPRLARSSRSRGPQQLARRLCSGTVSASCRWPPAFPWGAASPPSGLACWAICGAASAPPGSTSGRSAPNPAPARVAQALSAVVAKSSSALSGGKLSRQVSPRASARSFPLLGEADQQLPDS